MNPSLHTLCCALSGFLLRGACMGCQRHSSGDHVIVVRRLADCGEDSASLPGWQVRCKGSINTVSVTVTPPDKQGGRTTKDDGAEHGTPESLTLIWFH